MVVCMLEKRKVRGLKIHSICLRCTVAAEIMLNTFSVVI
jgi:hypothetical protein